MESVPPPPHSKARTMKHEEVAALMGDPQKRPGKDYIVVDVRRTDFKSNMVKTAINIPAQSFYETRGNWLNVLGDIPLVIFYCQSSNGRGPRCAGWYQDVLRETRNTTSEAAVLVGGIKQWAQKEKDLTNPILY